MPEDTKEIMMKLKDSIAIIAIALVAAIAVIIVYIVPIVQNILDMNEQYASQTLVLAEKQRELEDIQISVKKQDDMSDVEKEMFTPIETGLDTEGIIAGEFSEILDLIRANTIKTRSINYEYDPQDDKFIQGAPGKFNVAKLSMEMVSSYTNFENFLRDLYKHEHFLDISKVEIEPYEKDKSILLVNFELKLYAKK